MTKSRRDGMTMVELLVAVGILAIVVTGVMETFVVNNRAYTIVDETTNVQQNLRAISYLIERDLRVTGFMVPEGASSCGVDNTEEPDVLYVTDLEPLDPAGQTQANLGADVVSGYGGGSVETLTLSTLVPDDQPFFDTNGDGVPDSDFRCVFAAANCGVNGGAVILFDAANPGRGTACGMITGGNLAGNTLRVEFETSIGAAPGEFVVVPAVRYAVDGASDTLMRNRIPLARDVEDFQIAWFVDANDNGAVDANEYRGSADSTLDYASDGVDHSQLREVRFNLVVRSRNADVEYSQGFFQATENRAAVGAADGFRRRVFTSIVRPRNLGFRGVQPGGV